MAISVYDTSLHNSTKINIEYDWLAMEHFLVVKPQAYQACSNTAELVKCLDNKKQFLETTKGILSGSWEIFLQIYCTSACLHRTDNEDRHYTHIHTMIR